MAPILQPEGAGRLQHIEDKPLPVLEVKIPL
jgi:hypothetical protein